MKMFENWPENPSPKTKDWTMQRQNYSILKRQRIANAIAKSITKQTNLKYKKFNCTDLETKGIQLLDNLVTKDQAQKMYEYFYNLDCYDFYNNHEMFKIKNVPEHVKLGRHTISDNLKCPYVIELITNEKILNLASSFLGAPATLTNLLPMWSFKDPKNNPVNMQLFHRDSEDYRFIKIFVFLSDVEENDGEQVYIEKTNKIETLPLELYKIQRYPNDLIDKFLGTSSIVKITGKAGCSWATDPYGIHRGTVPTNKHRLLLQMQFSYQPIPIFNYKAYRYSKWNSLNELQKYTTRLYLRRNK